VSRRSYDRGRFWSHRHTNPQRAVPAPAAPTPVPLPHVELTDVDLAAARIWLQHQANPAAALNKASEDYAARVRLWGADELMTHAREYAAVVAVSRGAAA
jgi:hypothetical protein